MNILHNPPLNRFEVATPAGLAVIEYRIGKGQHSSAQTIDFSRTYVPPGARGQGVAEALVRRGLRWAREEGYIISASCWYVEKFLKTADHEPR